MDSTIIASIITGACTIIAALVGCIGFGVALNIKNTQKIKGDNNTTTSSINSENRSGK